MECEFSALEKTGEETTELQRSTKKVKDDHSTGFPTATAGGQVSEPLSYKAKLVGEIPRAFAQAFGVLSDSENDAPSNDENEDLMEGEVAIKLSRETKLHIREIWAHSLIIKVYGRIVGFHFLHYRIMQLWKPAGRLDCIDLGEDFFLIKFGLIDDYDKVLKAGPWFIGEHYLTIRAWEPYFKPNATAYSKVAVWARLPLLPIEFYDMGVLKDIGNAIGPVLRINATTASGTRGRYARICVQVDLAKPLVRRVFIGCFGQEVLYEGVSSLCFACGRLGHRRETCLYLIKELTEVQMMSKEPGKRVEEADKSHVSMQKGVGSVKDEYGPWMLVERRKQGLRQSTSRPNHSTTSTGLAGTFNAKDMGHHLRSHPSVVPPTNTPSAPPEDKQKSEGLNATSSASLPSPLKPNHFASSTPHSNGVVMSQPHTNPSNSIHKSKNRFKGKGKGKLLQQSQGEQKPATMGNKNQQKNYKLNPINSGADPI
nr:uncharacterized protein LOC112028949 [Quercus suber]POF04383.1 hypothetical protein CFP56_64544 [Quercus suber]